MGNELASCSTLCRFERKIPEELLDKGNEFLRNFFLRHGPRKKVLIIDVDNTPVETHGFQEGRKFNGHYDCNCYLPLLAFIEGYPIGVYNGTIDGRKRMLEVLRPLVESIRAERPNTREFRSNLYCVDENSWTSYANSVVDGQLFLRSLSQAR